MNMVVEDYQRLSEYTGKMAAAAAAGEWDELIALEQRCTAHVAILKTRDAVPADESARQQKVALIKKILADDRAIRDKTEPWMRQLERIMQNARSTQRLQQAYLSQG